MADIEFIGTLNRIRFSAQDSDFKIVEMNVDEITEGKVNMPYEFWDYLVVKGNFNVYPDTKYRVIAEIQHDPKWGEQYCVQYCQRETTVENMDLPQFKEFLNQITSYSDAIMDMYEDPRSIFREHDRKALMKVKGIGEAKAKSILALYDAEQDFGEAYAEFGKYGFSPEFTRKMVKLEGSPDLAINHFRENPYHFVKYSGVGFKMIDNKLLTHGFKVNDPRRVHAYIYGYFDDLSAEGSSWTTLEMLKNHLRQEIYKVDLKDTFEFIKKSEDFVVYKPKDQINITTKRYLDLEKSVGLNLIRLLNSKCGFNIKNAQKIVEQVESEQGWKYSDEQNDAIRQMLDKNVFLLQGLSGAGKTSTLNAVVRVLQKNNVSVATCALSGKAADNLKQITKKDGQTIHRLLGANAGRNFIYNSNNKLPYDVIVVDEVSMVNVELFNALVMAIKDGAKLIMIGDNAQLDPIGVGVMTGIMTSNVIPTVTLRQIHRQAQESAIVTHSLQYRKGEVPTELKRETELNKYGIKQDLGYIFTDNTDDSKINKSIFNLFVKGVKKYGVKNTQVLTPLTSSGKVNCHIINAMCQNLVNPYREGKKQVEIKISKNDSYFLRVGDRVINTTNNRDTTDPNGEFIIPIFNGNTGIIESIEIVMNNNEVSHKSMIINFDGVGRVLVEDHDIRSIQLGYCITVHKSQGSTIPCVLVALPYQYMLDSRELLYTALTRASKEAYLVTSPKTLNYTVKKTSKNVRRDNIALMIKLANKKVDKNV